jgi:hypothetical protein
VHHKTLILSHRRNIDSGAPQKQGFWCTAKTWILVHRKKQGLWCTAKTGILVHHKNKDSGAPQKQ